MAMYNVAALIGLSLAMRDQDIDQLGSTDQDGPSAGMAMTNSSPFAQEKTWQDRWQDRGWEPGKQELGHGNAGTVYAMAYRNQSGLCDIARKSQAWYKDGHGFADYEACLLSVWSKQGEVIGPEFHGAYIESKWVFDDEDEEWRLVFSDVEMLMDLMDVQFSTALGHAWDDGQGYVQLTEGIKIPINHSYAYATTWLYQWESIMDTILQQNLTIGDLKDDHVFLKCSSGVVPVCQVRLIDFNNCRRGKLAWSNHVLTPIEKWCKKLNCLAQLDRARAGQPGLNQLHDIALQAWQTVLPDQLVKVDRFRMDSEKLPRDCFESLQRLPVDNKDLYAATSIADCDTLYEHENKLRNWRARRRGTVSDAEALELLRNGLNEKWTEIEAGMKKRRQGA